MGWREMADGVGNASLWGCCLFSRAGKGAEKRKKQSIPDGRVTAAQECTDMRNRQNEAEMKLREVCLIEDFVVVSLRDKQRCFWPGVFGLDRDKAEKPSAREASR